MPTPKKGARLGGSAAQQRHMLSNLAASLFEHHSIKTTDAKAKVLRPYAEKIITKAKHGSVADRRQVLKLIPRKDIVAHLFDDLGPKFEGRDGGYTRTIRLDNRAGDNAPMSQISLVLEETVSKEADRATRAAASKKAEEEKAAEAEAVKADAEEATPAEAEPADAVPAEDSAAGDAAEADAPEAESEEK